MNFSVQEKVENSGRTGQLRSVQKNPENLRVVVKNVPLAVRAAELVFTGCGPAL